MQKTHTIFRKYGSIVEIINYEREPSPKKKKFKKRIIKDELDRYADSLLSVSKASYIKERRFDSVKRAKKTCLRRVSTAIEAFGSPLFITLTFEGSASDIEFASKSLTAFQRRLRIKYPESASLFVPELSPRGRIHFHGFIFGLPSSWGDFIVGSRVVEYGSERKDRILAGLWKQGFLDCKRTDGSPKLAYYITKYISKSALDPLFNGIRLLRISRGFPRELEIRGDFAEFMRLKYDREKSESFGWSGYTTWLGNISKKIYWLN